MVLVFVLVLVSVSDNRVRGRGRRQLAKMVRRSERDEGEDESQEKSGTEE